ncbi:unnamed protein product [Caenorhabditis bovis]|uniref:Uncharacterized protein n=1 Tax=Caenorhabditis bovis TaxID=2654633 RepID=A0A8S1EER9_9PELO|nr:unnamed protein product [Caenorhabditis bovis]
MNYGYLRELAEKLDYRQLDIETAAEFYEFLVRRLSEVWQKMSRVDFEEFVAERLMRFNGRQNQFEFFWKLLAKHYNI